MIAKIIQICNELNLRIKTTNVYLSRQYRRSNAIDPTTFFNIVTEANNNVYTTYGLSIW